MEANLRILCFQTTPLYEEFQLAVQACGFKWVNSCQRRYVFMEQEWKLEAAQMDASEATIHLRHVERKELSQILDRWLAMYLRFAVHKRQQTIGSKKATDDLPDKETQLRYIKSELRRMKEENEERLKDRRLTRTRMHLKRVSHSLFIGNRFVV